MEFDWLILSLLTAISVSSQDACVKKFFSHLNPYEMAVIPLVYSLPLFLAALLFVDVPYLDHTFWVYFLLSLPLNGVSLVIYMKAIQVSPLSLTLPYLAFSPVFMIATGYIFLGEIPDKKGLIGILIICLGAYILNFDRNIKSFFDPFKVIYKEKGSMMMLGVAILFSFAAVIGKKTILHSNPVFFTLFFFSVFNFLMVVFMGVTGRVNRRLIFKDPFKGVGVGLLLFCHAMFHGLAISLTKAAYMISVKRFSILFGIVYGRLIFREENTLVRLIGAVCMICGAAFITLAGD